MQVQALLLLLLLAPAWAIFEDQAGTYDWYKQYVGRPTTVAFLPGKERVFLSTQQNLLASLHTKAGSVAWRRKYTEQDPLEKAVALQKPALLLAASKGGKYVRAWDALEGGFKWEVVMFDGTPAVPGASCDIATVELGDGKGSAVAAVASDTLKVRSDLIKLQRRCETATARSAAAHSLQETCARDTVSVNCVKFAVLNTAVRSSAPAVLLPQLAGQEAQ